ncbi:Hypothetical_protein [Hexamita inflata]|uniref:Hypothetical_protein n=1 Tax=Hexamita inflata TaxID=28002 RepID=A0AA86QZ80_9EUKA|nr:Hypothetical protein HINF_LOCUS50049 [Hexamita inflata]
MSTDIAIVIMYIKSKEQCEEELYALVTGLVFCQISRKAIIELFFLMQNTNEQGYRYNNTVIVCLVASFLIAAFLFIILEVTSVVYYFSKLSKVDKYLRIVLFAADLSAGAAFVEIAWISKALQNQFFSIIIVLGLTIFQIVYEIKQNIWTENSDVVRSVFFCGLNAQISSIIVVIIELSIGYYTTKTKISQTKKVTKSVDSLDLDRQFGFK